MKKIISMLACLCLLTACPLEKKIDGSTEETMQKSIKEVMESLPLEKQEKFQKSLQVIMFSNINSLADMVAMGQNMEVTKGIFLARVNGKTADEVITIADDIISKKQGNSPSKNKPVELSTTKSLDKIAESAKADAVNDIMGKTISATLVSKKIVKGDYRNQTEIVIGFKNMGDKDINGIKGVIVFKDMFGDDIQKVNISYDDGIKAGKESEYTGYLDINQFDDDDKKLASTERSKIDFSFVPEVIIFSDGTKISSE